jgi:hypothetical protein
MSASERLIPDTLRRSASSHVSLKAQSSSTVRETMKRTRSTRSLEMAPGKNNEGFHLHDASMQNGTLGSKDDNNHVIVVGAGPAGLMLA